MARLSRRLHRIFVDGKEIPPPFRSVQRRFLSRYNKTPLPRLAKAVETCRKAFERLEDRAGGASTPLKLASSVFTISCRRLMNNIRLNIAELREIASHLPKSHFAAGA